MVENLKYYEKLLSHSYKNAVCILLKKYGSVPENYFNEKSYKRFINNEIKNLNVNKRIRRSDDGLEIHHIMECRYPNLSNSNSLRSQRLSYDYQKKETLVYCNLLEHMILHALICNVNSSRIIDKHFIEKMTDWYIEEKHPSDSNTNNNQKYLINSYKNSFLNTDDAKTLLIEIEEKVRNHFG